MLYVDHEFIDQIKIIEFPQKKEIKTRKEQRRWNQKEDDLLLEAIKEFGLSNWTNVAKFVGNERNRSQCSQRYKRDLCPNIKRDKWTFEEEKILMLLVQKFGESSWTTIAREMKTRSDVQCRFHFKNIIKKNLKTQCNTEKVEKIFGNLSKQIDILCSSEDLWEDFHIKDE